MAFERVTGTEFPGDPHGDEAFRYALYLYVRGLPEVDIAVDGWRTLQISRETRGFMRAVGIMSILPPDELPLEVVLRLRGAETAYWLRFGVPDRLWRSMTRSRRWKAVYLYAHDRHAASWNWADPVAGAVSVRS